MRRRPYLAATATALAGLAGCLSGTDGTGPADTTTDTDTTTGTGTPTETTTATDTSEVTVRETTLQQALVYLQTDYLTVHDDDKQYLLFAVVAGGEAPARDAFALEFAGNAYRPMPPDGLRSLWRVYNSDGAYAATDGGGLLVFELPDSAGRAGADAVLQWPGGSHRIADGIARRLAATPPAVSLSVDVPDAVPRGDSPTVALAVTNRGEVPRRFVAGLNRYGPRIASTPVERFSALVPPDETKRVTYTDTDVTGAHVDDADVGDGESDLRYRVNAAGRDVSGPVRYVEPDG